MFQKILFLFFPVLLFAQEKNVGNTTLFVGYTHSIHAKGAPSATVIDASLIANEAAALYEMDFMGEKAFIEEENSKGGTAFRIKPKTNAFVYKNMTDRSIFSILRISMKPFLVKDSIALFQWKIEDEFKEILGYTCQKATVSYRGRIYDAFFTTEVPFSNGPWKFSNLPGLILEVNSRDKVLQIKAFRLEMKNEKVQIENPFKKDIKTSISWDDFITEYKQKYEEHLRFRGPNGSTGSLPKEGIEIYIN